nr:reverse transcriptase domain, reverse transcriptase zinc-binding domain protein [Tanacetum cinerariifolium]
EMKKGKAKVAWDSVCMPKHEGGLGIARSGFSLDDSVNKLISNGGWRWPLDWLSTFPIMSQLQVRSLLDDIDDVILCRERDGVLRPFSVRVLCGMDFIPPRLIDVSTFITPISKGKTVVSILSRLVLAATSYYIWLERNGRLFKKKTSSPD